MNHPLTDYGLARSHYMQMCWGGPYWCRDARALPVAPRPLPLDPPRPGDWRKRWSLHRWSSASACSWSSSRLSSGRRGARISSVADDGRWGGATPAAPPTTSHCAAGPLAPSALGDPLHCRRRRRRRLSISELSSRTAGIGLGVCSMSLARLRFKSSTSSRRCAATSCEQRSAQTGRCARPQSPAACGRPAPGRAAR